jgi:osmotically inducible lipoprotein OsmB
MSITKILAGFALVAAVAGCMQTDGERALAGAAAGAIIADATDNNAIAGAALGGLAGATCDDINLCAGRGY